MQWTLETADSKDFLAIAALDRIAWKHTGEPFIADGEHVWRVWCEYATVVVARSPEPLPHSDHVAGALVMFPTRDGRQFLHKIMVHPACRGGGLGTELMRAALAQAQATSVVLLTVDPANEAAVKLYQNFGFVVHEHVRGYYRPHEDRLVMLYQGGISR
jgi:ribosomal protein S18 acetylase RimI-like enzyme